MCFSIFLSKCQANQSLWSIPAHPISHSPDDREPSSIQSETVTFLCNVQTLFISYAFVKNRKMGNCCRNCHSNYNLDNEKTGYLSVPAVNCAGLYFLAAGNSILCHGDNIPDENHVEIKGKKMINLAFFFLFLLIFSLLNSCSFIPTLANDKIKMQLKQSC